MGYSKKKFEYTTITLPYKYRLLDSKDTDMDDMTEKLNEYGRNGWELVNVLSIKSVLDVPLVLAFFKREV